MIKIMICSLLVFSAELSLAAKICQYVEMSSAFSSDQAKIQKLINVINAHFDFLISEEDAKLGIRLVLTKNYADFYADAYGFVTSVESQFLVGEKLPPDAKYSESVSIFNEISAMNTSALTKKALSVRLTGFLIIESENLFLNADMRRLALNRLRLSVASDKDVLAGKNSHDQFDDQAEDDVLRRARNGLPVVQRQGDRSIYDSLRAITPINSVAATSIYRPGPTRQ